MNDPAQPRLRLKDEDVNPTMDGGTPPTSHASPPFTPTVNRMVTVALVTLAVGSSLLSGIGLVSGQKALAVLPVLAVAGLALAVIALTRFAWFVLLLLAIRPSADIIKFGATDAASAANPSSLIGIAFLFVAMLWLASLLRSGRGGRPSSVTVMLIAFTVAAALSVIGTNHMQASAIQLVRLTTAIVMFVVLEQLITTRAIMKRVLIALFAGLAITIGYTLFVIATGGGVEVKGEFSRLTGPFTQSNDYARFLSFLILVGVAAYPYVRRRVKPYLFAALAVAGVLLVMTLTLGAIIAALVGCLIIALIQRRAALIGLLAGAAVAALAAAPGLIGRINTSTAESELGGRATGNSVSWRLEFWASLLDIDGRNPVTGTGLNTAQYFTPSGKHPHSDFLSAYVEMGALGFLLYVGLIATLFAATGHAVLRTERNTLEWGVAVGALAVVTAFALTSVAANVIQSLANFWYVLAITACALAANRNRELGWISHPLNPDSEPNPGGAASKSSDPQ